MRLAVLKERRAFETRVAATPETVKKLMALGLTVAVETGAGAHAAIPDAEFANAGAEIAPDAAAALAGAGIVFAVQLPPSDQLALIPRGALLVCIANAFADPDGGSGPRRGRHRLRGDGAAAAHHPRPVDGRAVQPGQPGRLSRGDRGRRRIPARLPDDDDGGRHRAARPRVRDRRGRRRAAGDRDRAAARRASSPRPTSGPPPRRRSSRSAPAFVGVEDEETAGQTGAYAREMSEAFRQKQAELMATTVAKNDIVICTALVMGRKAPVIVTEPMVRVHAARQRHRRSRRRRRRQLRRDRPGRARSPRRTASPSSAITTGQAASRSPPRRSMRATC